MIVASWNIEKSGQGSTLEKQSKVSHFIDEMCLRDGGKEPYADVIFLCEVHGCREKDYKFFLEDVYSDYDFTVYPGGNSNSYVVGVRKSLRMSQSYDQLTNLNRMLVLLYAEGQPAVLLAHFKSGGQALTKSQLENAAANLQGMYPNGRWAITGDLNWNFQDADQLVMPPDARRYLCWPQTHRAGGNLDWCIGGSSTQVQSAFPQLTGMDELLNMQGPDHRPVVFNIS